MACQNDNNSSFKRHGMDDIILKNKYAATFRNFTSSDHWHCSWNSLGRPIEEAVEGENSET
jgi:hypothetical protein